MKHLDPFCTSTPQYETHRATAPQEATPAAPLVRYFKVVSIGVGSNPNLTSCNPCREDGSGAGTTQIVVYTRSPRAVGDVLLAARPDGGTTQVYNHARAIWAAIDEDADKLVKPTAAADQPGVYDGFVWDPPSTIDLSGGVTAAALGQQGAACKIMNTVEEGAATNNLVFDGSYLPTKFDGVYRGIDPVSSLPVYAIYGLQVESCSGGGGG